MYAAIGKSPELPPFNNESDDRYATNNVHNAGDATIDFSGVNNTGSEAIFQTDINCIRKHWPERRLKSPAKEMPNLYLLCATVVVLLAIFESAEGLNCFQCNSTLDHNCQENFNHDFSINPLSSQYCTVWNSRYCIKITGLWGGVVGTHRFCSSRDLGDQCQDIFYPDHDRMYRACVYTCTSDDCNEASSLWTKWTLVTSLVLAFFSYKIGVL